MECHEQYGMQVNASRRPEVCSKYIMTVNYWKICSNFIIKRALFSKNILIHLQKTASPFGFPFIGLGHTKIKRDHTGHC